MQRENLLERKNSGVIRFINYEKDVSKISMSDIAVKKSKIHGAGIFATRDFEKGKIVIKWQPEKQISKQDFQKLSKEGRKNISFIDGIFVLVPKEARLNHSCNPNVFLKNFCYIAKKNIKNGEEITTDYSKESESEFEMICKCGSRKCNKIIKVK